MRKHLPPKDLFIGLTLPRFPDHTIEEWISSGSNGHVFRAHRSHIKSDLAYKFIPVANLAYDEERLDAHIEEARKANILQHPSVVKVADVFPYFGEGQIGRCIVLVCDYIAGMNLREYLRKQRENVNIPFVEGYLETMFEVLYELKQRNLSHGDLHAGNVLVGGSEYDIHRRPVFG